MWKQVINWSLVFLKVASAAYSCLAVAVLWSYLRQIERFYRCCAITAHGDYTYLIYGTATLLNATTALLLMRQQKGTYLNTHCRIYHAGVLILFAILLFKSRHMLPSLFHLE